MALLLDNRKSLSFQLSPVAPVADGSYNAYDVVVRKRDQVLFERHYTTYEGSPDGHWSIWSLFQALQLAETLTESDTPFDLSGSQNGQFNEPATLAVSAGWLNIILSGDTLMHRHNRPEPFAERRSHLTLYLLTEPQELGGITANYQQFFLRCEPVAVVALGQALETECREALRLRREIGTLTPADDYTLLHCSRGGSTIWRKART